MYGMMLDSIVIADALLLKHRAINTQYWHQGTILLICIEFNPSIDKSLHPL